jgi:ubiquinone/menaquinone biosynthesis C-methylase UbiE
MSHKHYYDNYWTKKLDAKSTHLPPVWKKSNLEWHYSFFSNYIGKNVLDVGAGDGTFLNFLIKKNKNIKKAVAAELSQEAIKKGKKKFPHIHFVNTPLEDLKLKSNTFHTVCAIEVVEHLLDIDQCLAQVARVLKPGGYFCVTTTDFNWLKKIVIAAFFWDTFFFPNNPHIRFFTKKTLAEICKRHRLALVDYKWNRGYFGLMPQGQMAVFRKML